MAFETKETQPDTVLAFMRDRGGITSMEAFELGITRLSAVIYTLRHKRGIKIDGTPCRAKTRYGYTTYYKYTLHRSEVA